MSPRLPSSETSVRRMTFMSGLALLGGAVLGHLGGGRSLGGCALALGAVLPGTPVAPVLPGTPVAPVTPGPAITTIAPVTTVAPVAPGAALLGDARDVRQQRHLAGVLDRLGHVGLLLGVVAGDPAGPHLGTVGHEPAQQVHVLPVDVLDALGDEQAGLLLGPAGVVLVLGPGLGGHQNGSSEGS